MEIKKLVIASHNQGKVGEIREMLMPYGVEVVSAGNLVCLMLKKRRRLLKEMPG